MGSSNIYREISWNKLCWTPKSMAKIPVQFLTVLSSTHATPTSLPALGLLCLFLCCVDRKLSRMALWQKRDDGRTVLSSTFMCLNCFLWDFSSYQDLFLTLYQKELPCWSHKCQERSNFFPFFFFISLWAFFVCFFVLFCFPFFIWRQL